MYVAEEARDLILYELAVVLLLYFSYGHPSRVGEVLDRFLDEFLKAPPDLSSL